MGASGAEFACDVLLVADEKGNTSIVEFSDVKNLELHSGEQRDAAPRKEK